MPKTGGDITKKRILEAAEELFSEYGFNGTSIDKIARAAGINKATIYYHFKNKDEIIASLFQTIIDDVDSHLSEAFTGREPESIEDEIMEEIEYLGKRKKILSVILMESLKNTGSHTLLFQCAESVMDMEGENWLEQHRNLAGAKKAPGKPEIMVYEFFTGFMPIILFVVFREKWCSYYKCSSDELLENFISAFKKSHLGNDAE